MSRFALGIELDGAGYHPAAWRRSADEPARLLSAQTLQARVSAAENAGFTLATFADSLLPPAAGPAGRVDAPTRASFVAATTSTLGLVPAVATTYAEPFHTASALATLDYSSRGRAGWLATVDPGAAAAWGRPPRTTEPELRREHRDSIEVARRLWDSWEDDAVIRDWTTGRFLDRNKLHYIDFEGESFSVKGPAIVPRPPQGQVVVFSDGVFGTGQAIPSELESGVGAPSFGAADVILVSGPDPETAIAAAERASGATLVFVDLEVALDLPGRPAADRLAELNAHCPAESGARLHFSGAPGELIALLTRLSRHVDGVRLHPAVIDEDLPVLARAVLPALFRTGVAHRPVPGGTLRANLGLDRPANRYAKDHISE
ncbi:alkanesulfonate monooxygenase SsuD/methylene tetrahydromethanopterin reductase-like flavin-dependent oxidoreductase (luciferase family) [Nocardia sp. GAS34]|uniref:LLM class flavin-dependent oxidoreductase n=1 Tax=unclassified Nocardia TaxID=2637762 RepID=UPI003D24DB32